MTRAGFVTALSGTSWDRSIKWSITGGAIRAEWDGEYWCPLTLVARAHGRGVFRIGDFFAAGRSLGLRKYDVNVIAHTSDTCIHEPCHLCEPGLRAQLLTACGLKEAL